MADFKSLNGYFVKDEVARQKLEEIGWASLKTLRDGGKLVPGKWYRITDYVTKTVQKNTQSANHAFDVIVRADSASSLNENAFAIQHDGDTYFASSKLNAWKLKYCLDNDTARFAWADTTNGKGVIYQMIDEFDNDLPYDFKNIQFKRYKVTKYLVNEAKWATGVASLNSAIASIPSLRWGCLYNESAEGAVDDNGDTWYSATSTSATLDVSDVGWWKVDDNYDMFVVSDGTEKWFYTFSGFTSDSAAVTDSSLSGEVYKNKFGWGEKSGNVVSIGSNVFIGNDFFYNTVGNDFYYNTVGNFFQYNTVGNTFYNNIVGDNFCYNFIGNNFYLSVLGDYFQYNTVGTTFYNNIVGNYVENNTIGGRFTSNNIGNNFSNNTIGSNCTYNTIGNSFSGNTIGNIFFSNVIASYYKWNHFEDGCQNLNFTTSGGGPFQVQKYRVLAGTAPSTVQTVSLTTGNTVPYNVKQTGASTISVEAA